MIINSFQFLNSAEACFIGQRKTALREFEPMMRIDMIPDGRGSKTQAGIMNQDHDHSEDYEALTGCAWCGDKLGQVTMPERSAAVFCSHRCEIEATFWLYQELCGIELSNPQLSGEDDI